MQRVDPYGLVGQVLDGQFRVDAPIGEGGFSIVYRGHHLGLDEPVAIKCLKLHGQLGSALVQTFERRFRDESKIQYKLAQGSLHIVRTIAAGTTMAPGTSALVPYMVLEWLEGFPLSEHLRARRERGERGRPLPEVIRLLDPVADAMAFAHSLGVVHRDINPSNVFMSALPGGGFRLKVMDFGVAKVVSDHALALGPRAATLGSIRMFTPSYGAPEQFSDQAGAIGPWTDVYAFGLLVVEVLTDRPPIEGEHLGELFERAMDLSSRPTPRARGATVGDAVEALIARALSVDPTRRPVDIGEFWGALKNAAARDGETQARRSAVPPSPEGAPLTSKGTLILLEQAARAAIEQASGPPPPPAPPLTSTQPLPRASPELIAEAARAAEPPRGEPRSSSPSVPRIDAYGATQEAPPSRSGASPLSITVSPDEPAFSPARGHGIEPPRERSVSQSREVLFAESSSASARIAAQAAGTTPGVGPDLGPVALPPARSFVDHAPLPGLVPGSAPAAIAPLPATERRFPLWLVPLFFVTAALLALGLYALARAVL